MDALEWWVMIRPQQAFEELPREGGGWWCAARRPLMLAMTVGAVGSLATSGRISLRLLLACTLCALYLPVLSMAPLLLIRRRKVSFARMVDLYFMGFAPWALWLIPLGAVWAFVPAVQAYGLLSYRWVWYGAAVLAFAACCRIDYYFLRCVLGKRPAAAMGHILVQRAITWTLGLAIFVGAAGWQTVATEFGW